MQLSTLLALVTLTTASTVPQSQSVLANAPGTQGFRIPTVHESAVLARRILSLSGVGTLSTVFPSPHNASISSDLDVLAMPSDLAGIPIGMMEYFASCSPFPSDPTILAVTIATSFRNAAAGSNVTLSVRWQPPAWSHYSAAALPRFSLVGYLEDVSAEEVEKENVAGCYGKTHPDARAWFPGNDIHESRWVTLRVEKVYWFGGFGDRAYIGWIPEQMWRNITKEEVEAVRLPGEVETKRWFW